MKLRHGLGVLLASSLLLTACTTDKGEIEDYNEQIQKAFDKENAIPEIGKNLNELEEKKQDLVKDVNGNSEGAMQNASKKVIDNIDERKEEFKKEEKAIDASEDEFKEAQKHVENISDDDKHKQVKELDDALVEKYEAHDSYAKAYHNVMDAEKSLFNYTSGEDIDQNGIDERSEKVTDSYKKMDKAFEKYSKAMNKVNKEKQDVDELT
ncbi:YkyA family protein [Staphylococcus auricularis]|uniref:YkyA family protein n=1 Tax=Staphylococcus auricularis TaxID=29379 RepID=UPI0012473276|nr:YkyA family protein [Staphylococcus auricularis]